MVECMKLTLRLSLVSIGVDGEISAARSFLRPPQRVDRRPTTGVHSHRAYASRIRSRLERSRHTWRPRTRTHRRRTRVAAMDPADAPSTSTDGSAALSHSSSLSAIVSPPISAASALDPALVAALSAHLAVAAPAALQGHPNTFKQHLDQTETEVRAYHTSVECRAAVAYCRVAEGS
jgi:hypothetical protein